MSYPAYPEYKDSGVEWLGEVPVHWEVKRLKRAISLIQSGTSVNAADIPAAEGELGVLKTSCVYKGWFNWRENKTVNQEDEGRVTCPLRENTLIVSRMNTPDLVGSAGLVAEVPPGIFLPDRLWQVFLQEKCSPKYYYYFTRSSAYRDQVKIACEGTSSSMQNLGQDEFGAIWHSVPSEQDQQTIGTFLDHETARIDALVEEQQRLIALLKEKRQAVISHAVTKGLNSDVPMKDSGVEWLGGVPAHWGVPKLKHLVRIRNGRDYKIVEVESGGCPVIGSGGEFARANDFLYDGESVLLGRKGTIDKPLYINGPFWTVDTMFYTELSQRVNGRFLYYYATCFQFGQYSTNTALPSMAQEDLANIYLAVPGPPEQILIATFLDYETARIDSLVEEGRSVVRLLQERRSALISAAVTGKIDVRGWQPPEGADAKEASQQEAV